MFFKNITVSVSQRSRLGPDLEFVVLDMDLEQQMARIRGRHDNDEAAVEMMKVGPSEIYCVGGKGDIFIFF